MYRERLSLGFFKRLVTPAGELHTAVIGENAGAPAPIIDYKPNDLWLEFPLSPAYLEAIASTAQTVTQSGPESGVAIAEACPI